jgi:hypothetical protein
LDRDAACVAAGSFVRSCPEESREYLATLRPIFIQNLRDPISTIRFVRNRFKGECGTEADANGEFSWKTLNEILTSEESRKYLATLRPIFIQNLRDPISTIRFVRKRGTKFVGER